jgi:protein TonB
MLGTLLESAAVAPRRRLSSVVSLALHIGAVAAIVVATAKADELPPEPPPTTLTYVARPPEAKPPVAPASRDAAPSSATAELAAPAVTVPALVAPSIIPLDIPAVDLTRAVTGEDDFARGSTRALAGGETGGTGFPLGQDGDVWFAPMVEKPAAVRPGSPTPEYPEMLRASQAEGAVRARFVVDTAGRVDLSRLTILSSDHVLFTRAVERALRGMRYLPAEVGGRPVAQLVEQTFAFTLHR